MEMTIFPPLLAVNLVSEHLLLLFSILIFAAVLVTKVGSRYGVPSLLLFLLLGMVAGEDVLGVRFDDFELAENIGHFAMTIILFRRAPSSARGRCFPPRACCSPSCFPASSSGWYPMRPSPSACR